MQKQKQKPEQRIRGQKLEILINRRDKAPFIEGLMEADKENRVIASNKRMDKILVGSNEWIMVKFALPCWTGTMTAYTKPDEKLGKTIEYTDPETNQRWVFPAGKFKGEKDSILVVEHPDFTLQREGNDILVVPADAIRIIANFPKANFPTKPAWYFADPEHGIPVGNAIEGASFFEGRRLYRIDNSGRVGPASRMCEIYSGVGVRWYVDLRSRPSYGLGMIVEAPR